jgi:hypothetical protein
LLPAAAEPFMPAEGAEVLENLAFDLAREASELSGQLHPVVRLSIAHWPPIIRRTPIDAICNLKRALT